MTTPLSYLYAKIHNHTYKTRQAEISIKQDLKSPITGFNSYTSEAWEEKSVPASPLLFLP